MGVNHIRPAFPSRAFRRLPLLLLATLALFRCDFFDIFPPEIEIITPKEGTSYFATLPIELKATDNRRVDKVEVFVNGTSVYEFTKSPYKTDISLAGVSSPATLQAIAHDQAGNSADASRDVNVTIGLRLTAPNGGESWPENSTQTITWESSGSVGSTVGLHYSTDGGSTWEEITGSTANNGTYTWTLPNFSETQSACKIKLSTSQYADDSDDTFTISAEPNTLTLTSPNGGEVWAEQSTQSITWTSSGDVGDNVSLLYSTDGGATWNQIISSTANDGTYSWTLPNFFETSTTCRIKVASKSTSYADTSDGNFTITGGEITLISPNGGETWLETSTQAITWTSSGNVGNSISLHYSLDGGITWTEIIASTPKTGPYSWTLPSVEEDKINCRVRVASTTTNNEDVSDANFTIISWAPVLVGSYDVSVPVYAVYVSGSYAYVGAVGDFLIISVSDPASPTLVGDYDLPHVSYGVYVSGALAYVTVLTHLRIINVIDPASPSLVGSLAIPGPEAWQVNVANNYAYVADVDNLQIINVSNPASPSLASSYSAGITTAMDVHVSGAFAYVADWTNGLLVIDVSNPVSPSLVSVIDTPGESRGVYKSGNYAYVADWYSLLVINVSDPANPRLVGSCNTPEGAQALFVSNGYAYVANRSNGLQVINVSDPTNPIIVGSYDTPGRA